MHINTILLAMAHALMAGDVMTVKTPPTAPVDGNMLPVIHSKTSAPTQVARMTLVIGGVRYTVVPK